MDKLKAHLYAGRRELGIAAAIARRSEFLKRHVFDHVRPGTVHLIDGSEGAEAECRRYEALIREEPIDFVFLGIGEKGPIAFNDPPVADFNDPCTMKAIPLEDAPTAAGQ